MENIIQVFLDTVAECGGESAISDTNGTFTYAQLYDYSIAVAANLRKNGVGHGSRVIVEIPRSKEYAACLIGCWLIGAVTIPLSDDYPEDRLAYIKKDSRYELSIDEAFVGSMDFTLRTEPVIPEFEDEGVVIYTSGSTGNPKGVVHDFAGMSAAAFRNVMHDKGEKTDRNNTAGLIAPFTFIVGMSQLVATLALAKHLVIISDEIRRDPFKLAAYYDENNIESSYVPPRLVDFMLKHNKSLKMISVGSERITNLYFDDHPVVVNGYGCTESFAGTLAFRVDKKYENTPIGQPIGDEKAYVLDENGHEAEFGELCIAGHVAKGYLNREQETKKSFIRNPFKDRDGFDRMFKTGDLVRRLPDGNLVFIERKDWMIKINGQRVEPLEVEKTIRRLPGIEAVAIRDFTAPNGITYLAAYYVCGDDLTEEKIRQHCKANLTSYMVPSFYIRMDSLPFNPNGKLDRNGLPEPDISAFKREYAAPEGPTEAAVADAMESVLGCGRIGRNDDFFLLGGDSVKVIEAINLLDALPLDIETFFNGRTPAGIVRLIENGGTEGPAFERVEKDAYPLTSSQLGIYFAIADRPETLMYNNPIAIRLTADIDSALLLSAVEKAVNNHKAYHCAIDLRDGVPCMIPHSRAFKAEHLHVSDPEEALKDFVRPFDLKGGELIRACLYEGGERKIFALDAHHIVFDGSTLAVLLKEIARAYDGNELYEEKTSAFDLSVWEESLKASEKYAEACAYYDSRFEGLEPDNDFPTDFPDTGNATQRTVEATLAPDREKMLKFLRENSVTENSLLLAAYAFVLAKFNGTDRSLVCVGESGRHTSMTYNTAGMMVKTIALPVDLSVGGEVSTFVAGLQETFRDSVANDLCSFGDLAAKYGLINDFGFVYQNDSFSALELHGERYPVNGLPVPDAMSKLNLMVFRRDDTYRLSFRYRSDLYDGEVIRSFADAYVCAVNEFIRVESLREVDLLSGERLKQLDSFCADRLETTEKTVTERFAEWTVQTPEQEFVVSGDRHISYGEAGRITDRLAGYIRSLGLGRNDVVSILIPRNEWIMLAPLGVLKAGCAYEPLDASYPSERLSFMVKNAEARLLITTRELEDRITGYAGPVLYTDEIASLTDTLSTPVKNETDDLFVLLYTSGTTGNPKGVMLTHGNASTIAQQNQYRFGYSGDTVSACYASFGFDACFFDLATVPFCGGCVHVIPEEIRLDLPVLDQYFIENRITHVVMTTQVGRQYALMTRSPYLRILIVGGEALVPLKAEDLSFDFYNLYGPTECTCYVTYEKAGDNALRVPIGRVNPNGFAYVVDANMNRLPVGAPGELLYSGRQTGKGYLNLPEKTDAVFIDNPFSHDPEYKKAYRTGDIVRFLPDGRIDFIGRHDGQVKVRGYRIELTEVEEIIRRFDGIKDATVAAFDDPAGVKYLAAYVVSDAPVDMNALRGFILSEKPAYMVPAVMMQLDAIPLTQNQKVNRRALPIPERKAEDLTAPENDTQRKIHEVISGVLGNTAFGIDTDLYYAGLTSISVIRLSVDLEQAFGIPFRVADIRTHSTVRQLEELIASTEKEESREILPDYPITRTQMGIYIECVSDPGSVTYNIPMLIRLSDRLDPTRLLSAVRTALDAHPYVKTTLFADAEGNIRARRNDAAELTVNHIKRDKLPAADELVRPFNLLDSPLCRVALYETLDGNYLFMDFHHIISDGTSENILLSDIAKAYAGQKLETEKYTGFEAALDEESARATDRYDQAKAYYDSVFKGCEPSCLPPKAPVPGGTGAASVVRVAETAPSAVESCCKRNKVTANAFFNAAFGWTLSRFGQFDDVVFTTVYNGRSDSRLAACLTMLVRTLPVMVRTGENRPVSDLLHETQEQLLDSMANDLFSFAEISSAYGIHSDILFVYQGDNFTFDTFCGEKAELVNVMPDVAKAPITLTVNLQDGKYYLKAEYLRSMYNEAIINSLLDVFCLVMKGFTEKVRPEEISLLTEKAAQRLEEINDTARELEDIPVHVLFERQAALHSDKTAVIGNGRKLTYRELNSAANRVAHGLHAFGIIRDNIVGMVLDRTVEIDIVELGIIKAGGAFLGLLPSYPDDRLAYCLEDAGSPAVITTEEIRNARPELFSADRPYRTFTVEELLRNENDWNPVLPVPTDSLVYCIYTSGSTGKPKGVMIEHRNLVCLADPSDFANSYGFGSRSGEVVLALSSLTFDMSIVDNLMFLLNGRTVCIATEREIHNPLLLAELLRQNRVDTLIATPSFLTNNMGVPEFRDTVRNMKTVLSGAEKFPASLYNDLKELAPDLHILNGYGPSECTITCCAKILTNDRDITIGGPTANTRFCVMDRAGNILPPYACGELIICGGLVGRGYVNLPEKTKASFFTLNGQPAYHSGDMVRFNADGEVEFFGRRDNQVKLRGFRVELDEIEKCICGFEGVSQSKVVVRNNGAEDFLAGFYTAETDVDPDQLNAYLKAHLTYYMVPDVMMRLEAMPLTASGKIDKKALPEIRREKKKTARKAARKSTEQELCELFASVLSLDEFYADDNFFEMGGTSLSASKVTMQLMAKGLKVEYQDVFDNPTPEMLADFIEAQTKPAKPVQSDSGDSDIVSDYPEQLQYNTLEYAGEVKREPLGDVLLTGAVGFLGIHVLVELIKANEGRIICLVRKSDFPSPTERLKNMLIYYFGESFDEALANRITVLDADITDDVAEKVADVHFDTIINCAACVKHYAADDILERINVHGVENMIAIAQSRNARMIQISTVSIPGVHTEETWKRRLQMYENCLFVVDDMGNKYSRSKYHAELKMLEAVKNGMRGKIIRVGNLMGRHNDGEFQVNFETNAFLNALRGFAAVGKSPISHATDPMSFSPIDMTARAVVLLAGTNDKFTAFNADSRFLFDEWQLIEAANHCGVRITPVADEEYYADYHRMLGDPKVNMRLRGLMTNDRPDLHGVVNDNKFTTNILYRLGFSWPLPDMDYFERAINSLLTLGYFDEDPDPDE